MSFSLPLIFSLIFLIGMAAATALNDSLRKLHFSLPKNIPFSRLFFYRPFHRLFFEHGNNEGLLCATRGAQSVTRFFYGMSALLMIQQASPLDHFNTLVSILLIFAFLFGGYFFGDYIPRLLAIKYPEATLRKSGFLASFFLFLAFPLTFLTIKLSGSQLSTLTLEEPLTATKREIIEIIDKAIINAEWNSHEKKLIASVLRFNDRIAREVMVPRVNLFSLSADTTIREAAIAAEKEAYSRIPVYKNSVDNIVGILMYKDILNKFMEYQMNSHDPAILEASIESIQKNVLYTPETKKISNLLLDFRKKQQHIAIVVDEYGGTEGIVTIEDILEEIVGEIEDEYDEDEELFSPQYDGSWIVDAQMGILDLEQQIGIKIPQDADYDTIGGFIFHCAGSIPSPGFVIHQEEFFMEILSSDERRVEKVHIKPIFSSEGEEKESNEEHSSEE